MRVSRLDTVPSATEHGPNAKATNRQHRIRVSRLLSSSRAAFTKVRTHSQVTRGTDLLAVIWSRHVAALDEIIGPTLSRFRGKQRLVAIVTMDGEVELRGVRDGITREFGRLSAMKSEQKVSVAKGKWATIELKLPSERFLRRNLVLPGAGRDFIAPILQHKLERLTPWASENVLFDYRVLNSNGADGSIDIELIAISKDSVAPAMQMLTDASISPTSLGAFEGEATDPLDVNLLCGAITGSRTSAVGRVMSRVLLASILVLIVGTLGSALTLSIVKKEQYEADLQLRKAQHLLRTAALGGVGDNEKHLLEAKQSGNSVTVLIARLAKSIPVNTFLKELSITETSVRMVGISNDAPALVGEVESSGLYGVRFTSAVTREKDQRDVFEITANRAPLTEGQP